MITDDQVRVAPPNEYGFEQWYAENAFDYERNPLGSQECSIARKAWHAALAARVAGGEDEILDRMDAAFKDGYAKGSATARAGVDSE